MEARAEPRARCSGGDEHPAGFSEISIARRLDRNGDGEYRLNGARCRLVDVIETLADANLGREMHSVISQGRVDEIVHSKPRDRRLLVEEAAGLGKHRKRRRRAQLKLERTQEQPRSGPRRRARGPQPPAAAEATGAGRRHPRPPRALTRRSFGRRLLAEELRAHASELDGRRAGRGRGARSPAGGRGRAGRGQPSAAARSRSASPSATASGRPSGVG